MIRNRVRSSQRKESKAEKETGDIYGLREVSGSSESRAAPQSGKSQELRVTPPW